MATESQITANRINSGASTGPQTSEGKARCAANAVTLGLFTVRDFIRPGEEDEYALLCAAIKDELHPLGLIEETLATEIIHAAWRLQRCGKVEAALSQALDPMEDCGGAQITQNAVDRARAQTQRSLLRLISELRRLQSGRQLRDDSLPESLASPVESARAQLLFKKLDGLDNFRNFLMTATAPPSSRGPEIAKQTQSAPAILSNVTPRNAPCPCGSGAKYKRCCGTAAPPVLSRAA